MLEDVLNVVRKLGYRHLEGVVLRLLVECFKRHDAVIATDHLRQAFEVVQSIGSESELAKTWLVATTFANELVDPMKVTEIRNASVNTLRALGYTTTT